MLLEQQESIAFSRGYCIASIQCHQQMQTSKIYCLLRDNSVKKGTNEIYKMSLQTADNLFQKCAGLVTCMLKACTTDVQHPRIYV